MMRTMRSWLAAIVLISLAGGVAPQARAGDLDEIVERGQLVVLCWPHQESIFVRRMVEEYGREGLRIFGGIDVDLMRAVADRLGVELDVRAVEPNFGNLIPALLAGEGDVIASSMTITRGRSEKVDFSSPYFTVQKVVVARRGSSLHGVEDLDGKVAAVAHGTSHEEQLLALGFDDLRLEPVQFMLENYHKVAEGDADFTLVDSSSAQRILHQYPDLHEALEIAFAFPESDGFGFAVRPGSDLLESLNRFLEEARSSGELEQIVSRHMPERPVTRNASVDRP